MRRRRRSRASRSRRSATTSPSTARRPSTASPCSPSCRSTRSRRGCPATTATIMPVSSRRRSPADGGIVRVAGDLSAQRQPAEYRQISLQTQMDGPAYRLCQRAAGAGRAADPGRRLQRHSGRGRCRTTRQPGSNDALYLPQTREKFRALINLGLTDAVARRQRCRRPLHLLGLSGRRLAEEQGHPHRPPVAVAAGGRPADRRSASASTCAAGTSRPTTCRSVPSWRSALT